MLFPVLSKVRSLCKTDRFVVGNNSSNSDARRRGKGSKESASRMKSGKFW
jgi:hypothetical protein